MVDLSTVLSIAQRSLLAARTALNVTANNIANADTPEYVRREAILEAAPAVSTSEGTIGGGVQIAQIKRRFDQLLTTQVLDFQGQFSRDSVLGDVLDEVEVFFQNTDGSGLGTDISRFFGAVQDLANNPSGNAERTALQVVTSRMADTFRGEGQWERAEEGYQYVILHHPQGEGSLAARISLADLYVDRHRSIRTPVIATHIVGSRIGSSNADELVEEALRLYGEVIQLAPSDSLAEEAIFKVALLFEELGDGEEALERLLELVT
ncbi:MAG: flagellar basal body protein, partial [Planctomycetota bacterium]